MAATISCSAKWMLGMEKARGISTHNFYNLHQLIAEMLKSITLE